jgi:hypothetical protein
MITEAASQRLVNITACSPTNVHRKLENSTDLEL